MRDLRFLIAGLAILCLTTAGLHAEDVPDTDPATPGPQSQVPRMLKVDWELGRNLPQGFQDSDGGFLGGTLITACGFCSGGLEEDNRRKPGSYPRGFLQKTWGLNTSDKKAQWESLPDFPGSARQGVFSAVVDERLYVWGGFNYTDRY